MGISLGSINTGLPKDIVKQIIDAEKIPLKRMEVRKEKIEERKQLVQELKELIKNIKKNLNDNLTGRSLAELKVNTNNEMVDVSVDKNVAAPGNYQLEVVQLAKKSSAISSGFEDPQNTYLGVGYIQYDLPDGETRDLYIDSQNSSLEGVANLINQDNENGIRANVINDGSQSSSPWRLLISLESTGSNSKADFPYFYLIDGDQDFYLEKEQKAQNAIIKIDGFEVETPGNSVTNIIPGVTVDLKKAKPQEEFSVNIETDNKAVSLKINDIVDSINKVFSFIKEQNSLDETTDTSRTLGGDYILQTIESRLRSAIFKDVSTSTGNKRLGNIGITFQRTGLLQLDQQKFQNIATQDYQTVSELLTGRIKEDGTRIDGLMGHFVKAIDSIINIPDGIIVGRERGLKSKIDQIDRRIEDRLRIIERKEKALKDKFAKLEGAISRIKSQQSGVASLSNLPVQKTF